ncbi:hypothetical protein [Mariniflexile sp.]|uniref:hypothetical protein n=1 Tax=Mariniflexile sp. TaxID=1979402 RepID=UPI0035694BF5
MKTKLFATYAYLFSILLFFGMYSCQTETLEIEPDLSTTLSKSSKKKSAELDWSCGTSATEVNLFAGQTILVGKVKVEVVGSDYKITYKITDNNYCITSTHLSVVESPNLFPNNNGNPTNGHFEYGDDELECVSSVTYTVPTSKGSYVAAHAVVNCKENPGESLPETINFCLRTGREIEDAKGYFRAVIPDGPLAGTYWAWCADVNKSINSSGQDICYENFNVYSLSDNLSGIISVPSNIDNALWLLNNTDALIANGYLYGYIQWAYWKLLNNQECNSCNFNLKLPSGDIKIKGMEIYNMALTNGEGFTPSCDEKTMVILDNGILQPIIIPVPVTCNEVGDCEETAWGAGCAFPGKNWASYFNYGLGSGS